MTNWPTDRSEVARFLTSLHKLSPFGIALIASLMTKAGVSEAEILELVL